MTASVTSSDLTLLERQVRQNNANTMTYNNCTDMYCCVLCCIFFCIVMFAPIVPKNQRIFNYRIGHSYSIASLADNTPDIDWSVTWLNVASDTQDKPRMLYSHNSDNKWIYNHNNANSLCSHCDDCNFILIPGITDFKGILIGKMVLWCWHYEGYSQPTPRNKLPYKWCWFIRQFGSIRSLLFI